MEERVAHQFIALGVLLLGVHPRLQDRQFGIIELVEIVLAIVQRRPRFLARVFDPFCQLFCLGILGVVLLHELRRAVYVDRACA